MGAGILSRLVLSEWGFAVVEMTTGEPDTKPWLKKIPVNNPTRSISTLLREGAHVPNPGPMQASALDLDKQCCLAVQSP